MNALIQIDYNNDTPTVLGRDLHRMLEVETPYTIWFPRMCEYGFEAAADFNPLKIERVQDEGGRAVSRIVEDHQLTIAMAKELCVLQRSGYAKTAYPCRCQRMSFILKGSIPPNVVPQLTNQAII